MDVDVAVVGGGLAGLAAARALTAAGSSVAVVEARERVGGRVLGQRLAEGLDVEVGAEFIGPGQYRMYELAAELGLETFPTYDEGDTLLLLGGRLRRMSGNVPPLGPLVVADLLQAFVRLERMARRVPLEAPWDAPRAAAWDAQTLALWMRRNVRTTHGRAVFMAAAEVGQAADPAEVSLLDLLVGLRAAGGLRHSSAIRGGAQQDRIVGGAHQVAEGLAVRLGDAVRLGHPVRRVAQDDRGVTVTADGLTLRAGRAVVAMSPALAGRIEYDPPLPADRDQLTQRAAMGMVVKCFAVYDRPFWRDDGLSGLALTDRAPVRASVDGSPPSGTPGVLIVFVGGRAARALAALPQQERRTAVVAGLGDVFGPAARRPVDYLDKTWADDPWARGCYAAHLPPGAWTQVGPALRRPVGRLHWAGCETSTAWNAHMEGAVRSGETAAAEVLAQLS